MQRKNKDKNNERKDVAIPANFSLAEEGRGGGGGANIAKTFLKRKSKQSLQTR